MSYSFISQLIKKKVANSDIFLLYITSGLYKQKHLTILYTSSLKLFLSGTSINILSILFIILLQSFDMTWIILWFSSTISILQFILVLFLLML